LGGVGIIYGSLDCGKSTFLRNFSASLSNVKDDVIAIYINLEERTLTNSLKTYGINLEGGVMDAVVKAFNNDIMLIINGIEPGLLVGISRFFYDIINELKVRRELRDKYVILVFDELDKAIGLCSM